MWPHAIALPIVLPLACGALLLLFERRAAHWVPWLAGATTAAGLLVALWLVGSADTGTVHIYLLGNWPAQFGIALALDRLSALLVLLTAVLGCVSLLYAAGGDARRGRHFHSLFQFQLMGLNGAFLTADLFNLFVFFEVLLIASYGLLLHGAGAARLRASIHYVSFNLAGSALFLIAVSLLYGLTGTLNMAELAQRVPQAAPDHVLLVQSAALMLIVVFGVKAALLPLYFWLPATYGAASAPVAALFAVMTKVGVYAILRVTTLIFGATAGPAAMVASPWLELLALATLLLGAAGALAAASLRAMIGNLVIASAGTLLLAVALARPDSVAAGLFYLVNSTLATAALFMLADRVRAVRGTVQDAFQPGPASALAQRLGVLFLVFAIAAAGLPPLAGFMGKAMLLQAVGQTPWAGWIVAIILSSSLLTMVAFARGGSSMFWKHAGPAPGPDMPAAQGAIVPSDAFVACAVHAVPEGPLPSEAALPNHRAHGAALLVLLGLIGACAVFAAPLSRYTQATAQQLFERSAYLRAVLDAQPVPAAIDVRREMRERKASGPGGPAGKPASFP